MLNSLERKIRMHGQREGPFRQSLRDREAPSRILERAVRLLQVQRDRIVQSGLNIPFGQLSAQCFPVVGLDDVLIAFR
jgi:hypothetical protein